MLHQNWAVKMQEITVLVPFGAPEVGAFSGDAGKDTERRGAVKRLLVFRGLAHKGKGVLASIHRFTDVISEQLTNFFYGVAGKMGIGFELGTAAFTHAEGRISVIPHDPQFALGHDRSLAHLAGRA